MRIQKLDPTDVWGTGNHDTGIVFMDPTDV